MREFLLTDRGVELIDAYVGSEGVLMGSARAAQTAREAAVAMEREESRQRKQRELRRKQQLYEAQLVSLKSQYELEREILLKELEEEEKRDTAAATHRLEMARIRHADISVEVEENGARKSRKGTAK